MPEQKLTSPMAGDNEIAEAFRSLGVTTGFNPKTLYEVGTIMLAWSGAGKTTFASSIPESLLLYFTPGKADAIVAPKAHRLFVPDYDTYRGAINTLLSTKAAGKCPYRLVTFDPGDEWFNVVAQGVLDEFNDRFEKPVSEGKMRRAEAIGDIGSKGKGYGQVADIMERDILNLQSAGFGWLVTGHLKEKTITVPAPDGKPMETTVVRPVLTDSAFQRLVRLAFLQLRVDVRTTTTGTKTVMIDGKPVEVKGAKLAEPIREHYLLLKTHQAGSRDEVKAYLPQLPDRLAFPRHGAWGVLSQANDEAVAAASAENESLTPPTH